MRFEVQTCGDTGGYVARWDAPEGGGITTQGDSFAELDAMVRDAVAGYFTDRENLPGCACTSWTKPGTLRGLIEQAGLTVEEFVAEL